MKGRTLNCCQTLSNPLVNADFPKHCLLQKELWSLTIVLYRRLAWHYLKITWLELSNQSILFAAKWKSISAFCAVNEKSKSQHSSVSKLFGFLSLVLFCSRQWLIRNCPRHQPVRNAYPMVHSTFYFKQGTEISNSGKYILLWETLISPWLRNLSFLLHLNEVSYLDYLWNGSFDRLTKACTIWNFIMGHIFATPCWICGLGFLKPS